MSAWPLHFVQGIREILPKSWRHENDCAHPRKRNLCNVMQRLYSSIHLRVPSSDLTSFKCAVHVVKVPTPATSEKIGVTRAVGTIAELRCPVRFHWDFRSVNMDHIVAQAWPSEMHMTQAAAVSAAITGLGGRFLMLMLSAKMVLRLCLPPKPVRWTLAGAYWFSVPLGS